MSVGVSAPATSWRQATIERRAQLQAIRRAAAERWGSELADLDRSEPIAAWPSDAEANGDGWSGTRVYPPVAGVPAVRRALAEHYARQLSCRVSANEVAVVPGARAGITAALLALLRPGDEVLVPVPCFPAYCAQVELAGGVVKALDTAGSGWRLTPDVMRDALGPRTRALLLSNPANPTGVVYSRRELQALVHAAGPSVAILADEVYAEFSYRAPAASLAQLMSEEGTTRRWAVVRSASKTIGRPGLRVGMVLGPAEVVECIEQVAATLLGATNAAAQRAFAQTLPQLAHVDHARPYRARCARVVARLAAAGFDVTAPEGAYYLWVGCERRPRIGTLEGAAQLAERSGVLVSPGELYWGPPSHARVSLSIPAARLAVGVERLADSFERSAA